MPDISKLLILVKTCYRNLLDQYGLEIKDPIRLEAFCKLLLRYFCYGMSIGYSFTKKLKEKERQKLVNVLLNSIEKE